MRNILLISSLLFFISCNNDDTSDDASKSDTVYLKTDTINSSFESPVRINNMVWSASFDSVKGKVVLKQQRKVSADTLTAEKLIADINNSWDDVKLQYRKISHDTLYVAIPESTVLTQQLGSSGAYSYISSTTYTLTELKNIKYINYDFQEGDHLSPGTMKRSDFKP
ncbi:MAG: hypothetical protein ABIN67_19185 [Ferruginibacter sp.]